MSRSIDARRGDGHQPRRRVGVAGLALAALLVLPGCVQHLIGPARTLDDYERKARTTATAAISTVETVLLIAENGTDGHLFAPFAGVSVSEQEDALAGIADGFRSIQPPSDAADEIGTELRGLLDDALDHVIDVRIEVRRGHLDDLDEVAAPLTDDADALRRFVEELA